MFTRLLVLLFKDLIFTSDKRNIRRNVEPVFSQSFADKPVEEEALLCMTLDNSDLPDNSCIV